MRRRSNQLPGALKHAGYSAMSVLPGENAAEFERLHQGVIEELSLNGVLENEIGMKLTRVVWRERNLGTFQIAELSRARCEEIERQVVPQDKVSYPDLPPFVGEGVVIERVDPAVRRAAIRAADDQARKELGELYELVEIGEVATPDRLSKELDVLKRLGRRKVQLLKELLLLRGVKSMSLTSAASSRTPGKKLSAA
jgi:hypothetical protein